jgi:DNA-binding MarR family transcriptional regulator
VTNGSSGVDDPSCVRPGAGVGFLISQLGFLISGRFKGILTPLGLEPRHFLVLRHLANAEGSSQHALGQALQIPASRMVGIVDALEQRGLVERRANLSDRRARALHLTVEGRRVLNRAFQLAVEHERAICAGLSAEERDQLIGLLGRLTLVRELVPGVHPALTSDRSDDPA